MYTLPNSLTIAPNHVVNLDSATLSKASNSGSSATDRSETRCRRKNASPTRLCQRTVSSKRQRLDPDSDLTLESGAMEPSATRYRYPVDRIPTRTRLSSRIQDLENEQKKVARLSVDNSEYLFALTLQLEIARVYVENKKECVRYLSEKFLSHDIDSVSSTRSLLLAIDECRSCDVPEFEELIKQAIIKYAQTAKASNNRQTEEEAFQFLSIRGVEYFGRNERHLALCVWQAALDTGCKKPDLLLCLANSLPTSGEWSEQPECAYELLAISNEILNRSFNLNVRASDWDSTVKPLFDRVSLIIPQTTPAQHSLLRYLDESAERFEQQRRVQISDRYYGLLFDILHKIVSTQSEAHYTDDNYTYDCAQYFCKIGQNFITRIEQCNASDPDGIGRPDYFHFYCEIKIVPTSKRDLNDNVMHAARLRDNFVETAQMCYAKALSAAKTVMDKTKDLGLRTSTIMLSEQIRRVLKQLQLNRLSRVTPSSEFRTG
jgi:hypothetical protein